MIARQLLISSPQLAYATFQAMLMMNLVDASVLQQVVATTGQPTQPTAASAPPPTAYPLRPVAPVTANVDPQRVGPLHISMTNDIAGSYAASDEPYRGSNQLASARSKSANYSTETAIRGRANIRSIIISLVVLDGCWKGVALW